MQFKWLENVDAKTLIGKMPILSGMVYCADCGSKCIKHDMPQGKKEFLVCFLQKEKQANMQFPSNSKWSLRKTNISRPTTSHFIRKEK